MMIIKRNYKRKKIDYSFLLSTPSSEYKNNESSFIYRSIKNNSQSKKEKKIDMKIHIQTLAEDDALPEDEQLVVVSKKEIIEQGKEIARLKKTVAQLIDELNYVNNQNRLLSEKLKILKERT